MICVLNSEELASKLGKKGSETDMTLYNLKKDDKSLTVASPTKYPEKLPPLLYSLYLGEEVYMVIDRLDRTIGEMMVACEVMGKKKGMIILDNYITPDQIKPLIKDTVLDSWEMVEGMPDPNIMREELLGREAIIREGPTRVSIDQSFPVKGLGTVSLGLVDQGIVKKHQNLLVLPDGKKTVIRSIQVHDNDVPEAGSGSRVGLVLKNVEPDDVKRGAVLAEEGVLKVADTLKLKVKTSPFWRNVLKDGMAIHISSGMQFTACTISMNGELKAGEEGEVTVKLDNQFVYDILDRMALSWLESTGPRVIGSCTVIE